MGVVYLGRDEALDRDVAIKTLRGDGSSDDESRGRFEIEAKAAARLQHPNIVTVFELGEDRGLPYIAMELLGGQDLETLLRARELLGISEKLEIAVQALRGLDFAHAHQIVHRDIKPSNLRVLDDGAVKILDFGIAKVESASVTRAGMMVGTPYYMSPEHIRGKPLDGRSDVFAMGVILHELFAGARPFTADDPTRVLYRIVNEPHPRLEAQAGGVLTGDIQRIIDKALEKETETRYASASLMADALARVREHCPNSDLSPEDAQTLSSARKVFAAGRIDHEVLQRVDMIALKHPEAAEAHRLSRAMKRKPLDTQAAAETASFPELDATFAKATSSAGETHAMSATIRGKAETISRGTQGEDLAATPPQKTTALWIAVGLAALVVLGGGVFVLRNAALSAKLNGEPAPTPSITEVIVPMAEPTASLKTARTASPGMTVQTTKTTTRAAPLPAPLHTPVSAPPAPFASPSFSPSPVVAPLPPQRPAPEGPPGTLVIESAYPVTVSSGGRVLATEKTVASLTMTAGSHEILIESAAVFLKRRETVQLEAGGSFTLRPPGTGKISVRASPDNCKVFIDGVFVDYPPILDHPITSGPHLVGFEWPDGAKAEQKIPVRNGETARVIGKKP